MIFFCALFEKMWVIPIVFVGIVQWTDGAFFSQPLVSKVFVLDGYCGGMKNLTSGLENITLKTDSSRKTLINCTVVIDQDVDVNVMQEVSLVKCKNKESPDSCTNFKSMKFPNVCPLLTAKNQIWSKSFGDTVPKIECPIRKGHYKMTNGYFDLAKSPIPMDLYSYWKLKFKFFRSEKMTMCFSMECLVLPLKNIS